MNKSQKEEIRSIYNDCKETNFRGDIVLFNDRNQYLFIDYKELNAKEIEDFLVKDFLINQPVVKEKNQIYNHEDGFPISYTISTFISRCEKRFGEKQTKILSNLFFYCHAKFNLFHFGHSGDGILNCNIIIPNELVKDVNDAFNLIFKYRNGRKESLRIIKLSNAVIFEMNIASFYHYVNPRMFIYKTKLLVDDDFIRGKKKVDGFGKWRPEIIDNPELNMAQTWCLYRSSPSESGL